MAATLDYRSRARRLRSTLRNDPVRLHRALAELARRQPSAAGGHLAARTSRIDVMPASLPTAAERFGRIVREQVDGQIVPFARRQAMLRAARRLGIGRFHANLVIAAEQYRYAGTERASVTAGEGRPPRAWAVAAIVLLTEACVGGAAWWAIAGS